MKKWNLLVTGGSGLLGGELRRLLPDASFPTSKEFNVTDYPRMDAYVREKGYSAVLHAAAFTSPPRIDKDPMSALEVNIVGSANVVKLCINHGMKFIYVSTDYVFKGDKGGYAEEDEVHPVNKYAWSKLGGECAARLYDNSLIIRTTFGPNVFPFEKAFTDQWTSRECVRATARKIAALAQEADLTGILHIGGGRKTVMEYAQSLDPARDIKPLSIKDVAFRVPVDTSLDTRKYQTLFEKPGEKKP